MRSAAAFLGVVALGLGAAPVRAEPNVIRDHRMSDLAITPTLGRGYSPGGNSLHGVCFDSMPTTSASFDFDYSFDQLDFDEVHSGEVAEFVRANTRERQVDQGTSKLRVYYLLATLTVDSYYSSIDEGKAKLSESALALLRSGDALGFFAGCGTHYLRSLSRRSQFLTLFRYTSPASKRDDAFERDLEQSVRELDVGDSPAEQADDEQLAAAASTRDLRIVSRAIGIVGEKMTSPTPFDLDSYKRALDEAFKAAQDEFVGRIVAAEVTPWLDNPNVLAALDLGSGNRWARKQILADNAEFYVALVERGRELEALVDKAGLCRAEVEEHFLDGGAIPASLSGAQVISHRGGAPLALTALVEALSPSNLEGLAEAERRFELGAGGSGGAAACVDELERGNLTAKSYREIAACSSLPTPELPGAEVIDEYCQPELAAAATP